MEKNLPNKDDLKRLLTDWGYQRENIPFQLNEMQLKMGHTPFGEETVYISLPIDDDFLANQKNRKQAFKYLDRLTNYYLSSFDMLPMVIFGKWNHTA